MSETFGLIALFSIGGIFAIIADYLDRYRQAANGIVRRVAALCGQLISFVVAVVFLLVTCVLALQWSHLYQPW